MIQASESITWMIVIKILDIMIYFYSTKGVFQRIKKYRKKILLKKMKIKKKLKFKSL